MSMKVPDHVTSADFDFDFDTEQIKPISSLLIVKMQSATNKKSNTGISSHIYGIPTM